MYCTSFHAVADAVIGTVRPSDGPPNRVRARSKGTGALYEIETSALEDVGVEVADYPGSPLPDGTAVTDTSVCPFQVVGRLSAARSALISLCTAPVLPVIA